MAGGKKAGLFMVVLQGESKLPDGAVAFGQRFGPMTPKVVIRSP